jgi:hypothetical protein
MVMLKFCVASGNVPLVARTVPVNVPATVGVPLMTPPELNVSPVGNAPLVTEKVGEFVAVYVNVYAEPAVPFGGGPFVIDGAAGAIVMLKFCVASGAVPFVAVTVPANVPVDVGVPLIAPPELNVNPVGKAPLVTEKVGALVAVYVNV